jgi:hypothetical protein
MNKMLLVAWILALSLLASSGQTNSVTSPPGYSGHWFAPPDNQSLKLPARPEETPRPSSPHGTFAFSNKEGSANEAALVSRVVAQGLFERSTPTYNNDLQRNIAQAFRPEILKAVMSAFTAASSMRSLERIPCAC